jgi:orotate phosphoribosyltransferase
VHAPPRASGRTPWTTIAERVVVCGPGGSALRRDERDTAWRATCPEIAPTEHDPPTGGTPMPSETLSAEVADLLLATPGGVNVSAGERFEFASGLLSPIYVDCRTLVSSPTTRARIVHHLTAAAGGLGPIDAVVGVATGGIPWAAWLSDELQTNFAYVRPAAKARGTRRAVEGSLPDRSRVLVIEDLITTGGSSLGCINYLESQSFEIAGMLTIFSYGLAHARAAFEEHDVDWTNLCGLDDLLSAAAHDARYAEHAPMLERWRSLEAATFCPAP